VLPVAFRIPFVLLLAKMGWMEALGLRQGTNNKLFLLSFTFTVIVVRAVSYSVASHFALPSRYLASAASGRSVQSAAVK
jgi:hypothetical protein